MIHLRSTSIQSFMRCREEFRQHYLMRRVSAWAEIHREFGVACHLLAQHFWTKGDEADFQQAHDAAINYFAGIAGIVSPADQRRYAELKDILPDCLAHWWDNVEYQPQLLVEKEWSLVTPWNPNITLSGRIDRVSAPMSVDRAVRIPADNSPETVKAVPSGEQTKVSAPWASAEGGRIMGDPPGAGPTSAAGPIILTDLKTCSEIEGFDAFGKKVGWERSYHDQMVKDFGIALYDWYLRQIGLTPTDIQLECLMKPYARYGKKARLVYISLPEVIAYRERFDQMLQMITEEINLYVFRNGDVAPWPMTTTACSGKYGNCGYLAVCNYGINRQTEKLYTTRDLGVYELEVQK